MSKEKIKDLEERLSLLESIILPKNTNSKTLALFDKVVMPFDSDSFAKHWAIWKLYRLKQHKFKYKSEISEQQALRTLSEVSGNDESLAIKIIYQSIERGWSGFFKLKQDKNNDRFSEDRTKSRLEEW
jgi:hypothetical protein